MLFPHQHVLPRSLFILTSQNAIHFSLSLLHPLSSLKIADFHLSANTAAYLENSNPKGHCEDVSCTRNTKKYFICGTLGADLEVPSDPFNTAEIMSVLTVEQQHCHENLESKRAVPRIKPGNVTILLGDEHVNYPGTICKGFAVL